MLTDAIFLWSYRERPKSFQRWLIVWGKRFIILTRTLRLLLSPIKLRAKGAQIGRLVVLGASHIEGRYSNLTIGSETSLGRCRIALHDRVTIGKRVVINDGVEIMTASHSLNDPHWRQKRAPIVICDYVWVATNAMILPGVTIGRGAVVGAGAVVRNDVPEYAVVIGNPAHVGDSKRTRTLSYSPVLLNAPFEAWIGRNLESLNTFHP